VVLGVPISGAVEVIEIKQFCLYLIVGQGIGTGN